MAFNISSIIDRRHLLYDVDRKASKKEKVEKTAKAGESEKAEENEKSSFAKFESVAKIERAEQKTGISSGNEKKLSDKAKEMLSRLREKYGELDIFVGNTDEELSSLSQYGNKEFSVIFSNEELERMAEEEEYADKQISGMEAALEQAKGIAEQLFEEDDRTQVNSFSISFGEDGTSKLFASLQRKPEANVEKVAENKHISRYETYSNSKNEAIKRTVVSATTADELLEQIKGVNWDEIDESRSGDKYNFVV